MVFGRDGELAWGLSTIPVLLAALVSLVALWLMFFFKTSEPLPRVDFDSLSPTDREALLDQRRRAIKRLADRKLIKIRQLNKVERKPLGALIGREVR